MLRQDIAKLFRICGYILLYLFAAIVAGGIGRITAYIAEKWILEKFFKSHVKPYRDWIEVSRPRCILTCVTGFLIVAVGLLFMHLVGLLPHEYDEVAVQVVVAFFGLAVFVCMCLAIVFVASLLLWIVLRCKEMRYGTGSVDEETALLEYPPESSYGTDDCVEDDCEEDGPSMERQSTAPHAIRLHAAPDVQLQAPNQSWINMINLSSVRNLDLSRIRDCLSDTAIRDPRVVH